MSKYVEEREVFGSSRIMMINSEQKTTRKKILLVAFHVDLYNLPIIKKKTKGIANVRKTGFVEYRETSRIGQRNKTDDKLLCAVINIRNRMTAKP